MKNIKNEILKNDTYRTEVLAFSCNTRPVRLTSAGFFHVIMSVGITAGNYIRRATVGAMALSEYKVVEEKSNGAYSVK